MDSRIRIDVTPAVEQWRADNPIRHWIDRQPRGKGFAYLETKLNVTRSAIYTWMYGKVLPPADTLLDLCTLIGIGYRTYIRWWRKFPAAAETAAVAEDEGCAV